MKTKNTLILLLVTGAVFAFMYFWDKHQPGTKEAERQAQNVVNFSPDKVIGMIIQNGDDRIELQRQDKKWRLTAPIKDQADSSLLDNIIMDIDGWQKATTISAKEMEPDTNNKLNEYGLNKPKLKLKVLGEGAPPDIYFGKDAVLEGKMYVRFENAKDVYVVPQSVQKAIDKKADDFRDKKLTDLTTAQLARVVLKTPTGELEFEKKDGHWWITRPLRARAEDDRVGDWLSTVTTAQIQQFVADDRGDLHPYGLAEPRGSITLYGENDKTGQMIQIGAKAEKQKDQIYVRSSSRGFVYTLPKKIEDMLNAKPNDLRDPHMVHLDTNILDRITIDAPGRSKIVLARKGEDWTIASRSNVPANAGEVRHLIDAINNEPVRQFVEDVASNLPKYGLDKPVLQITFSSFASENTAETKAGEQPIATVNFGKSEGDKTYVRVQEEPFVLAVQPSLLAGISIDPTQWQDLTIFAFKPEQIHRFSLTSEQEIALARGAGGIWNWTKGSGPINQTNVQSLLNTLAKLHAVRWVGGVTPPQAFAKPQLVVSFTTSPDDKEVHKLTIGGASDNGMWLAKVDEKQGVFVLSNPDLTAFKLSLIGAPGATPAPTRIMIDVGKLLEQGGQSASPEAGTSPPVTTKPVAAPTASPK